jgi:hypothetical protein
MHHEVLDGSHSSFVLGRGQCRKGFVDAFGAFFVHYQVEKFFGIKFSHGLCLSVAGWWQGTYGKRGSRRNAWLDKASPGLGWVMECSWYRVMWEARPTGKRAG